MLMMTFSPISIRPSTRGRAHVRQQHHVGQFAQARVDLVPVLEHVEARARDLARAQHPGQRVLVDHLAARGVHDHRRRLHQLQPPRVHQVEGRGRVRAVDRDHVHPADHLVEAFPIGRLQLLPRSRGAGGGGCGSGPASRRRGRGAPPPARSAPCRGCPAACPPTRPPRSAVGAQPAQSPACITASPSGMRRITARISAIVMSAVSSVITPGVFDTRMPRWRAVCDVDVVDARRRSSRSASAARPPAPAGPRRSCR